MSLRWLTWRRGVYGALIGTSAVMAACYVPAAVDPPRARALTPVGVSSIIPDEPVRLLLEDLSAATGNGDRAVLELSVEPHGTRIFAAHHGRLDTFLSPAGAGDLLDVYSSVRHSWQNGDTQQELRSRRQLFDALVGPAWSVVRDAETLVVIPDYMTSCVTFAALPHPETAEPLLETHRIVHLPKVRTNVTAPAHRQSQGPISATIVGDPTFHAPQLPALQRLPHARREAQEIARLYPGAILLTSDRATARRVQSELVTNDLVHVAAHVLMNHRNAGLSALVLAPDGGDTGLLSLDELSHLTLPHAPLIVVAGCSTGLVNGRSRSLRSFATALLAAGSRGVIATLWDIQDATSSRFAVRLHARLRNGQHPADALRATQREMRESADPALRRTEAWAGFVYYGNARD